MASNDYYHHNNSSHSSSQPRYAAMPSASVVAAILPEASSSSTSRRRKSKGKYAGSHHYTRDDVYGVSIEKKILRNIKSKFSHRPSYEFQPSFQDAATFNSSLYSSSGFSGFSATADNSSSTSGRGSSSSYTSHYPPESNYTHLDPLQLREQRRKQNQERSSLSVAVVSDDSESDPDDPTKRSNADLAAINNPYSFKPLAPVASHHRLRPKNSAATFSELVTQPASISTKAVRSNSSPNPPRVKFVTFQNTSDPTIATTSTVTKQPHHSTVLPKKSALKSSSSSSSSHHSRNHMTSTQVPSNSQEGATSSSSSSSSAPAPAPAPTSKDQDAHIRYSTYGLYIKKGSHHGSSTDLSATNNNNQPSQQPRSLSHSPSRAQAMLNDQQQQQLQRLHKRSEADLNPQIRHKRSHRNLHKSKSSSSISNASSVLGQGTLPIPQSIYDTTTTTTTTYNTGNPTYYYPQQHQQSQQQQIYGQRMISMVGPKGSSPAPPDTFTQMNIYMAEIMGGPHVHNVGTEIKFLTWTFVILALYVSFKFLFGMVRSWIQPLIQIALIITVIVKLFGLAGGSNNNSIRQNEGNIHPAVGYYPQNAQDYHQYAMNSKRPPNNSYPPYTN
ncbi:uncharacterized protein SAPINGB_P000978 [Magnusiomyces paraingens]|uniref:Uncharacterized protein n=1 Tax=Magnusiomyces paraingens TaxID=2606893 RepID=A0A5E8B548_9ASCO|nr:uncharacterized protein SAPINGB_P000978 [Saprochaete ingens]VVT45963.1 unnamed protein product [Saprochaete ingens]